MRACLIFLLLLSFNCYSQEYLDKKIIITVADSTGLYEKVKIALVKNDFQVKEEGEAKTLTSYPREFKKIKGYSIAKAVLSGNRVELFGVYGLAFVDYVGYNNKPATYKDIVYYKNSHGWKLLMQVANMLGGDISYSK